MLARTTHPWADVKEFWKREKDKQKDRPRRRNETGKEGVGREGFILRSSRRRKRVSTTPVQGLRCRAEGKDNGSKEVEKSRGGDT